MTFVDYITFEVILFILFIFLFLFIFYLSVIFIDSVGQSQKFRRTLINQREFLFVLSASIRHKHIIDLPALEHRLHRTEAYLPFLEEFDEQETSPDWPLIKAEIAEKILLPMARKNVMGKDERERHFACRMLYFYPTEKDEKYMLNLLSDRFAVNRYMMAEAVVSIGSDKMLHAVMEQMFREIKEARFAYIDALCKGGDKVRLWLLKQLKSERRAEVRALCIEILATYMGEELRQEILNDLHASDPALKLQAMKVVTKYPDPALNTFLVEELESAHWEIRQEAIQGLLNSNDEHKLERVEKRLNDSVWEVRLQAASSLIHTGAEGKHLVVEGKKSEEENISQVCEYACAFEEGSRAKEEQR